MKKSKHMKTSRYVVFLIWLKIKRHFCSFQYIKLNFIQTFHKVLLFSFGGINHEIKKQLINFLL